ncbi:hypothetical protein [Leptospira wolffii]|uniref:hypothetical protein n=1 Tax=Leptospira wolffii TaxID=409998 RepID=UPI0012EB6896|nr:hypothetical protein [Leptospira wolffii]
MEEEKEHIGRARLSLLSEFFFNILPLVILLIIQFSNNKSTLSIRDFIFVSIILYGQSIVKFASGVSNISQKSTWQLVSIIVSIVIVFGLTPSCILLVNLYHTEPNCFVWVISVLNISLSILSFFVIGLMGQAWLERNEKVD